MVGLRPGAHPLASYRSSRAALTRGCFRYRTETLSAFHRSRKRMTAPASPRTDYQSTTERLRISPPVINSDYARIPGLNETNGRVRLKSLRRQPCLLIQPQYEDICCTIGYRPLVGRIGSSRRNPIHRASSSRTKHCHAGSPYRAGCRNPCRTSK